MYLFVEILKIMNSYHKFFGNLCGCKIHNLLLVMNALNHQHLIRAKGLRCKISKDADTFQKNRPHDIKYRSSLFIFLSSFIKEEINAQCTVQNS